MAIATSSIRPAAVAGSFYPGQPDALRAMLESMLEAAQSSSDSAVPARERRDESIGQAAPPKILIAPHAGYQYSGPVAAHAYRLLGAHRRGISRVVLIGPAHRMAFRGIAAPTVETFWTPLGAVALDVKAIRSIGAMSQVVASDTPHAWEHALEVQLPFLQSVLERFRVVPLVVGDASARDVAQVLDALWGGEETVIVVSSDLSHYHEYALANQIDGATVRSILELRTGLDHAQACGATPINAALLCARRHGLRPRLLDLRNSGDTAGPRDRVVGYCAIAFDEEGDGDGAE